MVMTEISPTGAVFGEQIVALLSEIEVVLRGIGERLADERKIAELAEFISGEYKKLGEKPEQRNPDEVTQLVKRLRPVQEQIDRRHRQFPGTKYELGTFLRHLRDCLNRAPTAPAEIRDLRREIERLDVLHRSVETLGWQGAQTDLLTVRGRLQEMQGCLESDAGPRGRRCWTKNAERDRIIVNCLDRRMEPRLVCEGLDHRTIGTLPSMQEHGIYSWIQAWDDPESKNQKKIRELFSKVPARQKAVKPLPFAE